MVSGPNRYTLRALRQEQLPMWGRILLEASIGIKCHFTYLFIQQQQSNKYLLSSYYVVGTMLGL
jgi:hypothetical protein